MNCPQSQWGVPNKGNVSFILSSHKSLHPLQLNQGKLFNSYPQLKIGGSTTKVSLSLTWTVSGLSLISNNVKILGIKLSL